MHVRGEDTWDHARAAATEATRHSDVLLAADAEGEREALHGGAEARLPKFLTGLDVDRAEDAVHVAHESDAAGGGKHGGHKRRALLDLPVLFQGAHVVGSKFADVAVRARRFIEAPARAARAATALNQFHL